jgi:hypothetical protein
MSHIASYITFIISIILIFTALLILITIHNKRERREQCMMNHPAGRHVQTVPSHSGPISDDLVDRYKGGMVYVATTRNLGLRADSEQGF